MNILKILIYIVIGIAITILSYLLTREIGFLTNNKKKYLDYLNKIKENFIKYHKYHISNQIVVAKVAEPELSYLLSRMDEQNIISIKDDIIKKLDILINETKKEQNKSLIFNIILNVVFYVLGLITSLIL